jgi:Tol biopolymer transport system component
MAIVTGFLVVLGGFAACSSSTNDDPLGLQDGNTSGGVRLDGSADTTTALPDSAPPDSSGADASVDAFVKDSSVDAPIDTGVDAGPTTRLFFLGDYAVNNTAGLGRALVPLGASVPLSGVIAAKASAFAVTPDGTKVVFASDATVAGRFDLWIANADGTAAAARVALPNATGAVTDLAISPNGTSIAYIADAEVEGESNVYVVTLAGATPPVLMSPRTVAGDTLDAQSIGWSRDSVYLAMSGDFTVDKKNELYVVDTTSAVPVPVVVLAESSLPAPVGTGTIGISTALSPIWTDGAKVCVKADIVGTPATFRFFCANADGSAFATPASFPALPAQLGSYGISPDGATLAFTADSAAVPGAYEIYKAPSDDSAAAVRVTSGTFTAVALTSRGPSFTIPLRYSPDGTKIGFVGDVLVDNRFELYVVAADGATPEKRVAVVGPAGDANRDVQAFAWSPDSLTVAFIGDHRADNDFELFRVLNVTTADQVPLLVRGVVASGDITDLDWRP